MSGFFVLTSDENNCVAFQRSALVNFYFLVGSNEMVLSALNGGMYVVTCRTNKGPPRLLKKITESNESFSFSVTGIAIRARSSPPDNASRPVKSLEPTEDQVPEPASDSTDAAH